ncbi:MAG: hypothetical protein ACE5FJ_07620 [Gemmatimonadales bacterium]
MGYRRFVDRDGNEWEVKDRYQSEWELVPVGGNRGSTVRVKPPTYESDPYEMSNEEIQRLLDSEGGSRGPKRPSPFLE